MSNSEEDKQYSAEVENSPPVAKQEYSQDEVSDKQKQVIIKKLKQIPLEQLKEIITSQIDLEIRLKHQELKLTEAEISKIESQMLVLRKFFDIPNDLKISSEPNDFTLKYFEVLNKSLTVSYNDMNRSMEAFGNDSYGNNNLFKPDYLNDKESVFSGSSGLLNEIPVAPGLGGHTYRTRSTTSSLRPSYSHGSVSEGSGVNTLKLNQNLGCLYRRTDGIVVRLTCPDCQRSNFSSAQGFLNHSRIAHSKEYTSQDAAALKCGEILPGIKQDPEGAASIQSLRNKGLDPNKNLNVNEIYFNGLSNTLNTVHNSISNSRGKLSYSSDISNSRSGSDSPSLPETKANLPPKESELLKKLVKEGKMKKDEYEQLLKDTKKPIANSHLFENEVDEDDSNTDSPPPSVPSQKEQTDQRNKLKRRVSRAGINISSVSDTSTVQNEEPKGSKEETKRRKK